VRASASHRMYYLPDRILSSSFSAPTRAVSQNASMRAAGGRDVNAAVIFPRGALNALPDEHAGRRERFAELDAIQPGWQVELRSRPGAQVVEALFYSPGGAQYKSFADARRAALGARNATQQ